MQQHPSSQQQGLLEDLLTPITHTWTIFPDEDPGILHSFGDNNFHEEDDSYLASSTFLQLLSSPVNPSFPNLNSFTPSNVSNSTSHEQQMYGYEYKYDDKPKSMVSLLEGYPTMVEQEYDNIHDEHQVVVSDNQIQDAFSCKGKKSKSKKVEGQPSKNLMAERRRRKRLNDRLSMLRSIVPKISKMDRTSILGDTIDYMKELLENINTLKGQVMDLDSNNNLMGSLKESIVKEAEARNQPKFEVERRNMDTHVHICCSMKPGLLLSTVNVLEALGLDIQQCVISSFSDFTLHASCSEVPENLMTSSEEIKQILIKSARCGGRCL